MRIKVTAFLTADAGCDGIAEPRINVRVRGHFNEGLLFLGREERIGATASARLDGDPHHLQIHLPHRRARCFASRALAAAEQAADAQHANPCPRGDAVHEAPVHAQQNVAGHFTSGHHFWGFLQLEVLLVHVRAGVGHDLKRVGAAVRAPLL